MDTRIASNTLTSIVIPATAYNTQPLMDLSQNDPPSSDISDTDSENSSLIISDDKVDTSFSTPLRKAFKSYKTPTSMLKVNTPTNRGTTEKGKSGVDASSSPSATPAFISSLTTPSQSTCGLRGTSASRIKVFENAFTTLKLNPLNPPKKSENTPMANNKYGVTIIEDSDEEGKSFEVNLTSYRVTNVTVLTDTDVSQPPTRPASLHNILSPASTKLSISPAKLLLVSSSSSSISSVGSLKMDYIDASPGVSTILPSPKPEQTLINSPRPPSTLGYPVVQDDIFNAQTSNITMRKQDCPQVIQSPMATQCIPTQPLYPLGFEDQNLGSLASFSESPLGTHLKTVIVAHDEKTQALLDQHQISWGTQYELARGVSLGTWRWEEVKEKIKDLLGDNTHAACRVQTVMHGKPAASANPSDFYLWKELDREQAAIEENESRGLGLMGEWKGVPNWYGGQVQQITRLVKDGTGYKLTLEPMEKRRSHRFARFYGSRRFLQVRISEELFRKENDAIRAFFVAKFILCGRVFVPFHSKDGSLYMVESNENWERESQDWCGDQFRMPFREFINWHNPLVQKKNYSQAIGKYASRFTLGLSNSVPAIEFATEDIHFIDDIAASDWPKANGKPPTEKLMTDGCGLMNHKALVTIVRSFNFGSLPAGVQGRIDGSKGFWILHPTDYSDVPKIWIRDSQNKIKNGGFDRAHRIFDLLCPSRPSLPVALSGQSIINLFSNGIPDSVLIHLMEQGLVDEISPLLEWNKPHAMVFLWDVINKCGKVSGARTQRLAASLNRVLGLKGRDWGQEEDPEREDSDDFKEDEPFSTFTGRNKYSGAPIGLHEGAVELVQAGFHPAHNQQLFNKIGNIIQQLIKSSVEKCRIPILESLNAYVVPDPLGILKEGEIFYRSSTSRKDPRTEMLFHVLTGDVVVGRYPIRLPSDMQKVKAVDVTELYHWPDVVIISIQGSRSLASLLAGGDMDGDEVFVIWDPLLVKDFKNKPLTECPKDVISEAFLPLNRVENVAQFCTRIYALPRGESHEAFQKALIANLAESNVGMYSTCHDNCVAMFGYEHPNSIRLAYIVATLLDASKTGHRLQPGILEHDSKVYSPWAPKPLNSKSIPDILTQLKNAGEKKGEELLGQYREAGSKVEFPCQDNDLKAPYAVAVDHANEVYRVTKKKDFTDELALIRKHVILARETYLKAMSKKKHQSPSKSKKSFRAKSDQEDITLKAAREYAEPIPNILLTRNVEEVKASYAYTLNATFAFSVAFNKLCLIKALASPESIAPSLRNFDEAKSFTPSFLRALPRCENESGTKLPLG